MDSEKLSIRPLLNLDSSTENEDFQNSTLRPVLKLQHELILLMFMSFCKKQKIDVASIKSEVFLREIEHIIKRNAVLKNQYIGLVIGMFTTAEFETYEKNKTEYHKRIVAMIAQRISSNQAQIKNNKQQTNNIKK